MLEIKNSYKINFFKSFKYQHRNCCFVRVIEKGKSPINKIYHIKINKIIFSQKFRQISDKKYQSKHIFEVIFHNHNFHFIVGFVSSRRCQFKLDIQNYKNSKLFESLKYKNDQILTKTTL